MMDEVAAETPGFESHRRVLLGIAYRMLGSRSEAEDIVQEAFVRRAEAQPVEVTSERAYLARIVTHLCLDHLKSARARREVYVGPWLPEPVRTDRIDAAPIDVESISLAFLVLLESLTPVERAVYLLAEVFDYRHAEVADIVGRDEVACRQLLRRARDHVAARRPRFAPTRESHSRMLAGFAQACRGGDLAGLTALLAADVTSWSDGGGKVMAAKKVVHGAEAVARMWIGIAGTAASATSVELAEINGWPAMMFRVDGRLVSVFTIETDGALIHGIRAVLNPDKLGALDLPAPA